MMTAAAAGVPLQQLIKRPQLLYLPKTTTPPTVYS